MENKRIYRNLDDATKTKISQKMRNRGKTESHKQAISDAMKKYWEGIPYQSETEDNNNNSKNSNNETNK